MALFQSLAQYMDAMAEARRIRCPYCNAEFDDSEDRRHVTCWGEDPAKEQDCPNCENTFLVKEHVERTYTTSMMPEDLIEQDAPAEGGDQ